MACSAASREAHHWLAEEKRETMRGGRWNMRIWKQKKCEEKHRTERNDEREKSEVMADA